MHAVINKMNLLKNLHLEFIFYLLMSKGKYILNMHYSCKMNLCICYKDKFTFKFYFLV